jgi:DNA-directed RNA polymerase specialized sigma24 family protein
MHSVSDSTEANQPQSTKISFRLSRIGLPEGLTHMESDNSTAEVLNKPMADLVEGWLRHPDRPLEGVLRKLYGMFPTMRHDARPAVGHGTHKLIRVKVGREPPNPLQYVTTCAVNYLKDEAKRRARSLSLDALRDDEEHPFDLEEPDPTAEERQVSTTVYRELCTMVERWETENVRATTLLFLEAAYLGEPLPSREAAEALAGILNEEVDEDFVRQWKSRGFRKLREEIEEMETLETGVIV